MNVKQFTSATSKNVVLQELMRGNTVLFTDSECLAQVSHGVIVGDSPFGQVDFIEQDVGLWGAGALMDWARIWVDDTRLPVSQV
jgi:hypothetical protein